MEEIIIDGVNVAGCEHLEEYCCKNKAFSLCQHYNNCTYKQLKRLEQENECLKEKLIIAQNSDNKTMEILKENAELQTVHKQLKQMIKSKESLLEKAIQENAELKKAFVSHSEFMDILENNSNINWEETAKQNIYLINKYHKALEEIREITETITPYEVEDKRCLDKILNKINEVLK